METRNGQATIRDKGGSSLFLVDQGLQTAMPPILLEAGGGAVSSWWTHVQEHLAEETRVLAYDRQGLGRSQTGGKPRPADAEVVARELERLLAATVGASPCLLVGHSLGGLYVRYFAATRADRVAGLVLVDPMAVEQTGDAPARLVLAMTAFFLATTAGWRRERPPERLAHLVADLPEVARRDAERAMGDPRHLRTFGQELLGVGRLRRAIAGHPLPRALPLLVIGADRGGADRGSDPVSRRNAGYARASDWGRSLVIPGSTHGSLLTDPDCARRLASAIADFAREVAADTWTGQGARAT